MLKIERLSKSFGKKEILKGISYEFNNGVYGLLGPNGAGKTTLLRCILNLYHTEKGMVILDEAGGDTSLQGRMGYLPQKSGVFPGLTVEEQLMYFANVKNIPKEQWEEEITRVLELVHLSEVRKVKGRKLSGGMARRVGIAQALLNHPVLVIFDEPTTGLDPEERIRFKHIVRELHKESIVILSTHIVEDIEAVCDEIIILNQGNILASGSQEIISKLAEDKVYELTETQRIPEDYVEKELEVDGEMVYRVLTGRELPIEQRVRPNIEDGYICALKGI